MDHKELFIGISITTTASFFSSIAGTTKCSAQAPLHLSDSHESGVKSKYKSSLYKLWQYATKNKPSLYNDGVVHYNNKTSAHTQRLFTSYKCFLKRFFQLENYIKQAASIQYQRLLFCKNSVFSRDSNNIGWRNALYFVPHFYLVCWIFAYIKNVLRREQSNNHTGYSKLNNLILQIYKIKRQREKAPQRISLSTNKILHNKVYC
ncbi:hypothetical protein [Bartonella sp. AU18XJBT]|uniref:hypothetical protein n=1 Tax=Bartonella sp. AU18XJBT TaxID=3019089 RepID=UPI0023606D62|nr:hypothetical protein [Bartonella sp. AU18XJBT]